MEKWLKIDDKWRHIVFVETVDNNMKSYVDGVLEPDEIISEEYLQRTSNAGKVYRIADETDDVDVVVTNNYNSGE